MLLSATVTVQGRRKVLLLTMSRLVLEKELSQIRQRLEAIEEALGKEMTAEDKAALSEALNEHREGKSIPFKRVRARTRKR